MIVSKRKSVYALSATIVIFLAASTFAAEPLLPEGLIIEHTFKPGLGPRVGKVVLVLGKVVIMHKDMSHGYRAKKNLPLFNGDILISQDKGFMRFKLNDGSTLTLGSRTKLVINHSIFDSARKNRTSFLRMNLGKTLFRVTKMIDFEQSDFKVQTSTAIIGIRGSEFVVRATPQITEVTALEDTELEVASLAFPEAGTVIVADLQRTIVEEGAFAGEVEMVSPEEVEGMRKEFSVTLETPGPEGNVKVGEGKAKKKEGATGELGERSEENGKGEDSEGKEGQEQEGIEEETEGEEAEDQEAEGEESRGEEGTGKGSAEEEADDEGVGEESGTAEYTGAAGMGQEYASGETLVKETPMGESIDADPVIFVPVDELVMPEDLGEPDVFEEPLLPDIFEPHEMPNPEEEVTDPLEDIPHEEPTTEQPTELPSFPGTPQ